MSVLRKAYVEVLPQTDRFESELAKRLRRIDAKKDGDRIGKGAGDGLASGFARGAGTFAKTVAAVSSKISLIGGAAAGATTGVGQLVGALAPAAGALVALPASMAAFKAASATFKVATAGVGEAISAGITGTAKEAESALKELPPAAQTFARSIIALKPQIEGLKATVAERFFRPMQDDIATTAKVVMPALSASMADLAGPLGGLGEQFLQTARKAQVINGVKDLFYETGNAAVRLRPAVDAAGTAFGAVLSATSSMVPQIAGGFSAMVVSASKWITQAAESGRLNEIFAAAVTTLKDLGGILANVGSILGSVFSAASAGGGSLLSNFRELTAQFAAFLKTAEGQAALTALFDALGAIATVVRSTLAPVLPLVARALAAIAPVIPPIVAAVGSLIQALTPILPVVAQLAVFVGQVLGKALQTLVPILVPIISTVVQFAGTLVSQLLPAIRPLIDMVIEFAGAFGKTLLAVLVAAMPALTALVGAVASMMPALQPLQRAVLDLSMAFLPLLPAVIGLAATLVQALLPVLVPIIAKVAEFATTIVQKVVPVVQSLVGFLTTGLGPALSWLGGLFSTVWRAISSAVMTAWNNIIKPAVSALVAFFTGVIAPTAMWLWKNVLKPAFDGAAFAVQAAWVVIQIALKAFQLFLTNVIFPVVRFLYDNVVKPVFSAIGATISWLWNVAAKPVFLAFKEGFATLGAGLSFVWDKVIKPVFNALGGFITNTVVPAFGKGVDAIKAAWDKIKGYAREPVAFVVNEIVNPFIGGINAAADLVGVKDKIPTIPGFARGGQVPGYADGGRIAGAPSSVDNRLAPATIPGVGAVKLAGGEFIVNAADTAKALPLLRWVNDGMRGGPRKIASYLGRKVADMPGDGSEGWAFADGGLVGWAKDVWGAVSNPGEAIEKPFKALLGQIPGVGKIKNFLIGSGKRLLSGAVSWLKGVTGFGGPHATLTHGIYGGNVGKAMAFLRSADGKPYGWAQAGPNAWDCSGIVSSVYNILHGKYPYTHTFSTAFADGWFPKKGPGLLTAAWSHPGQAPASNSVGHMMGRLGNLTFESTGSRGVHLGASTRRIEDFANIGHYARGGRIPLFDDGGILMPGINVVRNGLGRPEPLRRADTPGTSEEMTAMLDRLDAILVALTRLGGEVGAEVAGALQAPMRRGVTRARTLGPGAGLA